MHFKRTGDIKKTLNIGIEKNLPIWMENSKYDIDKYYHVWQWAMEEEKYFIFPYIINKRGKKWFNGEKVEIDTENNNELLWRSVDYMCYPAVKALLEIPDLFDDEIFIMSHGTSALKSFHYRGDKKSPYLATNFGAYVQLAMTKGRGDWKILDALKDYYKKYKK